MNIQQLKKENQVALLGIGLILVVISITVLKPVLKNKYGKESREDLSAVENDYEYITSKELQEKINQKEKLTIIDIRDSVNYEKEHIEKSINMTPDQMKEKVDEMNKEEMIVIIGYNFEDKNAEAGAIKFFQDSGFTNVVALSGGIFAWKTNLNSTINLGDPKSITDVSKVDQILPEQLKIAIENDYPVFIIDTRSSSLFAKGHIAKAINIPLDELEQSKREIPFSKEIVTYGDSELTDFQSGVKLHDLGFLATYTLQGGFSAWQEKRFPIEK